MTNTDEQPLATFIIVGWNNKDLLDECFESISQQTYKNHSTIYVDNGSSDDSINYVRKKYPEVMIIDAGGNLGFAIGNNLGIKNAFKNKDCSYVALLNSDARLHKTWLEKLVGFANEHPRGASFQTPTFDYFDHAVLDSIGITIDHYGRATQLGYRQTAPAPETMQVFGVNAAAALFSRAFLSAQPFGEDYFDSDMWMYLEDVDLAARATVMGWENWFVNMSGAYHMGSATSNKNPGFSVYMVYRNNLPMLVKNLPLTVLMRILPGLFLTDIKSLYQLLRGHNFIAMKSIIKGRLKSIPMLPKFISKRSKLQQYSGKSTSEIWSLMSRT